jgi:hypothetical protein
VDILLKNHNEITNYSLVKSLFMPSVYSVDTISVHDNTHEQIWSV